MLSASFNRNQSREHDIHILKNAVGFWVTQWVTNMCYDLEWLVNSYWAWSGKKMNDGIEVLGSLSDGKKWEKYH